MVCYAIGDVQGCHDELERLLDLVAFDPAADRLWLVGDLVNRGPRSLETLRLVKGLGDAATTVLGNHDLHLLAAATGARKPHKKDTLSAVLEAPDRDELIDWLRHRPALVYDREAARVLVHAGLPPAWDIELAARLANELEAVLRGARWRVFFDHMYGNTPRAWDESLSGWERLRYVTNALTRMRYVDASGRLDFDDAGAPGTQRCGLIPWFAHPARRSRGTSIIFGHWATLQTESAIDPGHGVIHVDTGCVWGGTLRAVRLDDGAVFETPGLRAA